MSWKGDLLKAGIDSDGYNINIWRGNLTVYGTITYTGGAEFAGDITLTDALILENGRLATGAVAGSAIDIDGTAWPYSEGVELRYTVSDWADTYTLTSFRGMYLRAQSDEASSNSIYGLECYGVTNAVNITNIWGALFYGYVKGAAAVTVGKVYGIQTEVSWDAGSAQDTLSTEATPILAKVTSGAVDDYTKIHGMIIRMGDMDGGSRTYGSGIKIEDDADMSGTSVFTYGLNIPIACTTGIYLGGAMTDGLVIAGACGDNGIEITGACTDSAIQIVTGAFGNGLFINADGTTAINISSNFTGTTGILIAGTSTNAISITGTPATADIALHNGATIMNGAAGVLTITEEAISLAGAVGITGSLGMSDDLVFTIGTTVTNASTKITMEFDETTTGIGQIKVGDLSNAQVLNTNPGSSVVADILNILHSAGAGDCDDLIGRYTKVAVSGNGDSGLTAVGEAQRLYIGTGDDDSVVQEAYAIQPWAKHTGTGTLLAMSAVSAALVLGDGDAFESTNSINAGHFHIKTYGGTANGAVTSSNFDGVMIEVYGNVTGLDSCLHMTNGGTGTDSMIKMTVGGAVNVLEFAAAGDSVVIGGGTYSTADGYFVIKVGGDTYRVPFFTAVD